MVRLRTPPRSLVGKDREEGHNKHDRFKILVYDISISLYLMDLLNSESKPNTYMVTINGTYCSFKPNERHSFILPV